MNAGSMLLPYPTFWGAWCFAELLFFCIIWLYVAPRMNRLEPPPKFPIRGKRLMTKVVKVVDWLSTQADASFDFSTFLGGWFLGTPTSKLRRDNVVEFMAWAMYAKETEDMSKSERKNVTDGVKMVERRLGRTLEPGYNPEAVCIRHTLETVVPFSYRPLVFYAFLGVFRVVLGTVVLKALGFRRCLAPCGTFPYWYREAPPGAGSGEGANGSSGGSGSSPIVFFHGVSAGLLWYVLAIWRLCRGRTTVIVESPFITMSLHLLFGHAPPSETRLVESVERIMERHGLRRATFFGHSFGSVCVAWMVRRRPKLVSQVALLDPVCFLLFLPDVASSFLFPDKRNMSRPHKMVVNIVCKEMGIAHTLRRHFWWNTNTMWPEDIQCPVVVGLAGKDKLIPVRPLRRFLLSYPSLYSSTASPGPNSSSSRWARANTQGGNGDGQAKAKSKDNKPRIADNGSAAWGEQGGGGGGLSAITTESPPTIADDSGGEKDSCWSGFGAAGPPKRVELVFWPGHGHGSALADPGALKEFDRVCRRQEEAFAVEGFSKE